MARDPLPDTVRAGLLDALHARDGRVRRPVSVTPIGGGSISRTARVSCDDGLEVVVKWHLTAGSDLFLAEADGLAALRNAGTLRVPEVLGVSPGGVSPAWLLLEYLPAGPAGAAYGEDLGRGLAALHREAGEGWGWRRDNYIGSLPQSNRAAPTWAAFWRDRRLAPQVRRAVDLGHLGAREVGALDRVLGRLDAILSDAETDGPSLLHGDLWSGNAYAGADGDPVIIDPAVHRGHREVDLAMTELFGGFPAGFYDAYDEAWPLPRAYHERRRDCYQLYYLLVHVNLFGRGYVAGTLERARRLAAG